MVLPTWHSPGSCTVPPLVAFTFKVSRKTGPCLVEGAWRGKAERAAPYQALGEFQRMPFYLVQRCGLKCLPTRPGKTLHHGKVSRRKQMHSHQYIYANGLFQEHQGKFKAQQIHPNNLLGNDAKQCVSYLSWINYILVYTACYHCN